MRKILRNIFFICVTCGCFALFSYTGEKNLYPIYSELYDYRRLTPELLPSEKSLRILSVGHNTTYADTLWVSLIQFIGDNIGNNKYLDFSHHILSSITSLHPFFPRAYELDLIYTPLVFADSGDKMTDDEREKTLRAIDHGKA